jgi:hypothetical protein
MAKPCGRLRLVLLVLVRSFFGQVKQIELEGGRLAKSTWAVWKQFIDRSWAAAR